ncbi:uncharacterized protein LOC111902872 [Lactuca sativa]|uniref:uncharacterized protein LOC111902872 n=1 Tax=Lactuca sativa TaxID=4236 RepID=UPI000CD84833|nr:uncharacterized protein LOC111902872 [Lactuca sativa]
MLSREDGWTQVCRKRPQSRREQRPEETTFFVTNIPDGTTKAEFRTIFSSFGKLSDIYFGEKKGKNRKNFGFIRFLEVDYTQEMESKLNGTRCRNNVLEINIERHGRKTITRDSCLPQHHRPPH